MLVADCATLLSRTDGCSPVLSVGTTVTCTLAAPSTPNSVGSVTLASRLTEAPASSVPSWQVVATTFVTPLPTATNAICSLHPSPVATCPTFCTVHLTVSSPSGSTACGSKLTPVGSRSGRGTSSMVMLPSSCPVATFRIWRSVMVTVPSNRQTAYVAPFSASTGRGTSMVSSVPLLSNNRSFFWLYTMTRYFR